jgi:hypothetical protein
VVTGIGLPEDGLHSPNEKLDLAQLWNGIQIFGRFFEMFAERGGRAVEAEPNEDVAVEAEAGQTGEEQAAPQPV